MNEVLKNIQERRSCRKYKSDMVPDALIDQVIEAGLYAPSSLGQQSGLIVAVTDPATRDQLSKLNARFTKNPDSDPFYGAPVVLIVLARTERQAQFCDGCLMMENMMLAAQSLGLGTCWIHRATEMYQTDEGKNFLASVGVEGEVIGVGHCILGYPDTDLPEPPARKDGRVFYVRS
ncbi:MAG: nitroreductase [Peptococcaceae bacterium]|nr:nitroreductase [Peptococcaceae bacterium]